MQAPPPLPCPRPVHDLAQAIHSAGGRALVVGGSVRDHLLGLPLRDWDLECYGLSTDDLEATLRTLGRVDTVGKAFAVLKVKRRGLTLDVSIPRRDSKSGPGHRGIHAEGDPSMTPEEAVRRRDLTVNAIMFDPLTRTYLDPAGGLADLAAGQLRPVDASTFLEDPLRALRAVQFVARFGFQPTPTLTTLCTQADLHELPAERVFGEWRKLLLKGTHPAEAFAFAHTCRVLPRVFPDAPSPPDPAVMGRATALRRELDGPGRRLALMLGAWLHAVSDEAALRTLDALRVVRISGYPTRDRLMAARAQLHHPFATDAHLRWLSDAAEVALTLCLHESITGTATAAARAQAATLGVLHEPPEPMIKGRDLIAAGLARPGPELGVMVRAWYERQLSGEVSSRDEALAAIGVA